MALRADGIVGLAVVGGVIAAAAGVMFAVLRNRSER